MLFGITSFVSEMMFWKMLCLKRGNGIAENEKKRKICGKVYKNYKIV